MLHSFSLWGQPFLVLAQKTADVLGGVAAGERKRCRCAQQAHTAVRHFILLSFELSSGTCCTTSRAGSVLGPHRKSPGRQIAQAPRRNGLVPEDVRWRGLKIDPMSPAETPTLDSWPDLLSKPDLLSSSLDPSTNTLPLPVLEVLLIQHIKPIFDSNIHPSINPTTGRKLPRPAGGPLASQDFYDSQRWKEHPGIDNVIRWCLKHIDVSTPSPLIRL